ncbi:MAG: adenylate/guanylate cyclase domain-containing protein [Geminicoccaceae bacterium]|nr:adenylate/guanylate cyclase domain-containing protein [Geminicoccaceae bacterium]
MDILPFMVNEPDSRADIPGSSLRRLKEAIFGPPLPEDLPPRIVGIIHREQERSEILISLVQICAIVFFFAFYALTPKAFPPSVPFEPIPWALALYAVFTGYRTWLAMRHELGRVLLTVSVVVDITLLMVTIWSFHLQYNLPPEMYLKAPTLMYVFILIALRTLRFEPGFVIIAGLAAAGGWIILVLYAVHVGDDSMITHSFATYVTSYSVLIGAEVDKMVSILIVTLILAISLSRSRKLLYRAAMDRQAAVDLSKFFAPEVAGRIREQKRDLVPGTAELRHAAILFIDLRGFTRLGTAMSPADVMHLLSDYQSLMVALVRRHGGSIDKYMGDGILASFGATRISDSFAADAARCLEAIVEDGKGWTARRRAGGNPAPEIAAAMTCGTVMFGTVGDRDRLEYTVLGEPVNLAAKLEKHCKVEGVRGIVTRTAWQFAVSQGFAAHCAWNERPQAAVEGIDLPVDLMTHEGP